MAFSQKTVRDKFTFSLLALLSRPDDNCNILYRCDSMILQLEDFPQNFQR